MTDLISKDLFSHRGLRDRHLSNHKDDEVPPTDLVVNPAIYDQETLTSERFDPFLLSPPCSPPPPPSPSLHLDWLGWGWWCLTRVATAVSSSQLMSRLGEMNI
jgi:hypothetical protein